MAFEVVPGLALEVVKQINDRATQQLGQTTAFFGLKNADERTSKLIGSGVLADLHGTRVILTAGHVLRDFAREFDDERVLLSVNRAGSFVPDRNAIRVFSKGGDHGPDAGVLVLPEPQASSYFHFGAFNEPARRTTLIAEPPSKLLEVIVAGFPAQLSKLERRTDLRPNTVSIQLNAQMMMIVATVDRVDDDHVWLWAGDGSFLVANDQPMDMGSLNGMSGCGCWEVRLNREEQLLHFCLRAVHTATHLPHLRETAIIHHLRLIASLSAAFEEKVRRLWPDADL